MKATIYQLKSPSGKCYIGSTTTTLKRRVGTHFYYLRTHTHCNFILQNAYNKHGMLEVIVLEEFEYTSKKEVSLKEQYYLDTMKPEYNLLRKANTPEFTAITRDKLRAALKGRKHSPERIANMKKGREDSKQRALELGVPWIKFSETTKLKLEKARKERQALQEYNKEQKRLAGRKPITEEAKKNMSIAHIGHKHSEESKRKLSESLKGRKQSANHKLKSSENHSRGKMVLNMETGIYYPSIKKAAESIDVATETLYTWVMGKRKNKSSFIIV